MKSQDLAFFAIKDKSLQWSLLLNFADEQGINFIGK